MTYVNNFLKANAVDHFMIFSKRNMPSKSPPSQSFSSPVSGSWGSG